MTTRRARLVAPIVLCLLAPPALATWNPPAPAPVAAPERDQVRALLDAMSRAVLAADKDAYLARVWTGDDCWATEQRNWAADLDRHVPASFALTLDGDAFALDGDWADVRLVMAWEMPGARPRRVDFPARFFRDPDRGWLYAGERWNRLEGDRVLVLYDDGMEKAAATVAEVLPAIREHVLEGFELQGQPIEHRVQQVKLYGAMRHLQQSIYLSYTDGLGGWNEPGEAIKLLVARGLPAAAARVLIAHEYGHVATFELGDSASSMPWWALEGVAELSAERYSGSTRRIRNQVRRWAERDELIEWSRLADFRGEAADHYAQVYAQGHHMLGYISDRFGRAERNRWLTLMARGHTLDDATREALALPFADLDKAWRESLLRPEPLPERPPDPVR